MLFRSANENVVEKTTKYMLSALVVKDITRTIGARNGVLLRNHSKLEGFLLQIMGAYPDLPFVYFAAEDGSLMVVKRLHHVGTVTKILHPNQKKMHWIYRDYEGKKVNESYTDKPAYDPRKDQWYMGAKQDRDRYWTDVHRFFDETDYGISASVPV